VEAVQERLIWEDDTAVAVRFVGVEGEVVSVEGGGAEEILETVTVTREEVV
jgi:hypothetical protein